MSPLIQNTALKLMGEKTVYLMGDTGIFGDSQLRYSPQLPQRATVGAGASCRVVDGLKNPGIRYLCVPAISLGPTLIDLWTRLPNASLNSSGCPEKPHGIRCFIIAKNLSGLRRSIRHKYSR